MTFLVFRFENQKMSRTQELISNGLNLVQKINEILNDNTVPCEKLFLGNLSPDTEAQDLKYFFRKYKQKYIK